MGFWDKVKELASDVVHATGAVISGVARATIAVGRTVVNVVKTVATKVVIAVANHGNTVINVASDAWNVTKHVIRSAGDALLNWSSSMQSGGLKHITSVLGHALNFTHWLGSNFGKPLRIAMEWLVEKAKNFRDKIYSKDEMIEAKEVRDQLDLDAIEENQELYLKYEQSPIEMRNAYERAQFINKFLLVRSELHHFLQDDKNGTRKLDFQRYLQLKAAQRLMDYQKSVLDVEGDEVLISDDDIFLVDFAEKIVDEEYFISKERAFDQDAEQMEALLHRKFGKKLVPFVFEEIVPFLREMAEDCRAKWIAVYEQKFALQAKQRQLTKREKYNLLKPGERETIASLKLEIDNLSEQEKNLERRMLASGTTAAAAEAYIQALEKDEEKLIEEGKEYLLEYGEEIGELLLDLIQEDTLLDKLPEMEQWGLLVNLKNIFEKEMKARKTILVQ